MIHQVTSVNDVISVLSISQQTTPHMLDLFLFIYKTSFFVTQTDDPKDPVLLQKLGSSDIVFLLHDASRPSTLDSIKTTWLPLVKAAFGSDRSKSAVIIRSKNDLFTGICEYQLNKPDIKRNANTSDSAVPLNEEVAISQDGTGPMFSKQEREKDEEEDRKEDSKSNDMTFSYMGVDITQPDKFSTTELEIGRAYSFISALSMYVCVCVCVDVV